MGAGRAGFKGGAAGRRSDKGGGSAGHVPMQEARPRADRVVVAVRGSRRGRRSYRFFVSSSSSSACAQ